MGSENHLNRGGCQATHWPWNWQRSLHNHFDLEWCLVAHDFERDGIARLLLFDHFRQLLKPLHGLAAECGDDITLGNRCLCCSIEKDFVDLAAIGMIVPQDSKACDRVAHAF